ncbi:MAG: UDP-N-acetylmuramoyl-tripeptide--D-alanyl-D-alanine ligase [Bacteroidales bacterium]|nr:UDP-N-acetylmuramoyl-tripeptide--D-alanyl-D-alanine ligase [Bacteroidales bacterium]
MEALYNKYVAAGYRVTTDSRAIQGGEIFFAIRGENFDGNDFALKALEAGASYAVVNADAPLPDNDRLIRVEDTLQTLSGLAIHHRTHVGGDKALPVIGLTGTNGKTTTKELIRAVLSAKYRVTATEGNLNNDIGVPLSLLKIRPDTQIAVIEMGANHPDDIAKLVRVSRPDYGLITNVGKAHLLGFGSFEGVKAAKGELYKWLGSNRGSLIFLNEDDADLRQMAAGQHCHIFGYGVDYQSAEILPTDVEHPYLRLSIDGEVVSTSLVGSYNAPNVMAALAVGDYFGVSRKDAAAAIAAYCPENNRSQLVRKDSCTIIVDAYNANPSSMSVAIDNFAAFNAAHKVALLGDMRELGDDSLKEHKSVVDKVKSAGLEAIYVGEEFRKAVDESGSGCLCFGTSAELAAYMTDHKVPGTAYLVKGSRGIMMEKVLAVL